MTDRFYSELRPSFCVQQLSALLNKLNKESRQIRMQIDLEKLDPNAAYSLILQRLINGYPSIPLYRCKIKSYNSGSLIEGYFDISWVQKLYLAFLYSLAIFPLIMATVTALSGNGTEGFPYCLSISVLMSGGITISAAFYWVTGQHRRQYIREFLSGVFPANLPQAFNDASK
jgi:hypothetical protein